MSFENECKEECYCFFVRVYRNYTDYTVAEFPTYKSAVIFARNCSVRVEIFKALKVFEVCPFNFGQEV